MSTTNSAYRPIRGRTSPPLAHRSASLRGARRRGQGVDKAWTSPAVHDSALTEIGPGRVQLISEPRQVDFGSDAIGLTRVSTASA